MSCRKNIWWDILIVPVRPSGPSRLIFFSSNYFSISYVCRFSALFNRAALWCGKRRKLWRRLWILKLFTRRWRPIVLELHSALICLDDRLVSCQKTRRMLLLSANEMFLVRPHEILYHSGSFKKFTTSNLTSNNTVKETLLLKLPIFYYYKSCISWVHVIE